MNYLSTREVAELAGCNDRLVKRRAASGEWIATLTYNDNNRPQYRFAVSDLPPDIQRRYYSRQRAQITECSLPISNEAIEELSDEERAEVKMWAGLIERWQIARQNFEKKTDADKYFVNAIKLEKGPLFPISECTLYRKWKAYKAGDIKGLLDKRGGYTKGQSNIPDEVWDYFIYCYLDQRQLSIRQCYNHAIQWAKEYCPECVDTLPCYASFGRRLHNEIPKATVIAGREGEKAFSDRAAPYINRLYDELKPNDYWIADNHTLDIISQYDDGSGTHRLSLTAFIDARSGVMVGWNLTDNPNSQSTVLALRKAILRFGIPKKVYFDNGSEFLTHDLAGRGHRTKKNADLINNPPPVFQRLGMIMTNAIVRNAKAKPIERTFSTFKGSVSRMFETYCGGNVTERPEQLKYILKAGKIPTDSELREVIDDLIDGIYNVGEYGGKVASDRGKKRIDVWNEHITEIRKPINEDDLNLMLLRSARPQTVKRNGVCLNIAGEKLEYWDENTWKMLGEKVYIRYNPEELNNVRIYNADDDRYICTLPLSAETSIKFDATNEEVALAQRKVHEVHRSIRKSVAEYKERLSPEKRIDILDMQIRRAHEGKGGMKIEQPNIIVPVMSDERQEEYVHKTAVGQSAVVIDINKMNANAERRKR